MTSNAIIKTLSTIRPQADVDPAEWTHHDGSPLTPDELHLVLECTVDDFRATNDFLHDRMAVMKRQAEVSQDIVDIGRRYADLDDDQETIANLMVSMDPRDAAQLRLRMAEANYLQDICDALEAVTA